MLFLEGPAGVGKTTYAIQHIRNLVDQGESPESLLVLVPHPALGEPYQAALADPSWPAGAQIDVTTFGALARRSLNVFWPLVAQKAGFVHPEWEPVFLTIETAQYYMANLVHEAVREGVFDSISITPHRIMSQVLDNLSKSAVNGFPLEEVTERLIAAWGDRHSSRPLVYRAALDLARQFRDHCRQNSLIDFSFQIDLFVNHLLHEPQYQNQFRQRYHHLIVDNLEENVPVMGDFVRQLWPNLESALLIYDIDGGYRSFLGADPAGMYRLRELCDEVRPWSASSESLGVSLLVPRLQSVFNMETVASSDGVNARSAFTFASHKFYPEMIRWTIEHIVDLVQNQQVPPQEIVVLAPFLGDSLRFTLETRLDEYGIPSVSHRPSRAIQDEPATRAILTLMALAHPAWNYHPPVADVADALYQVIEGLDPVRAWLLAQIVYKSHRDDLGSFDTIETNAQERITFVAGNKYERLRQWLIDYRNSAQSTPPDHFLSRLFGEVLAQPGYGFHTNLDAGRSIAELVESARKFRQTLYPGRNSEWDEVAHEYYTLIQEGLLSALYMTSWQEPDAVFLAPAHTFLMRNRHVDYQFWLDAGSDSWFERLEQPLTHPYVLSREYPRGQVWTDELEFEARRESLRRLVIGLARRCRNHLYIAISELGEQGYEQRGKLLQIFQSIMQES
jgi:hypothetical protein